MKANTRLIDLAAAVGDGAAVDWGRVEGEPDARTAKTIRQLRIVERIAAVHAVATLDSVARSVRASDGRNGEETPGSHSGDTWGSLAVGERIGRGTHGDVYVARDIRLDRPVALKLLHRCDAGDEAAGADIIHEARLLARVHHPSIVTVYGAERIDGRVGIWMELVDGRTLEQELGDRGPFAVEEIVAIGTALCGAVDAVHAAGLLHRDVKAQNVLRGRDGRFVLTDFSTGRDLTRDNAIGELAGTPLYLAPELLEGEPASVASDVYSLGVLLYHLATASYPVGGRSVADLRDAFREGRRSPLLERRPDLPRALTAAIERAIDPVPSRRYGSAAALGAALEASTKPARRLVRNAVAALLVLAAVIGLWGRTSDEATAPRFVLVSAFANETGDSRLDDVVQFAFTRELMQSRAVTVVPPERIADALRLMKREVATPLDGPTAREISLRDGNIQLIATGRIDRLSSTYTMHVAIDEAASGTRLAQASVEVADIDRLLDGVRTIAATIRTAVGEERRQVQSDSRLARVTTGSLDALRDYTAGLALVDERRWAAAELRLGDAVRHDPSFASALIMLAHSRRNQMRPADDWMPVAEQAFRLADGLPARERYFIQGSFHQLNRDLPRAIAAYEVLIREQPNDFWGLNNLAGAYVASGRSPEEIPLLERLVALRPNDISTLVSLAARLVMDGDGVVKAGRLVERASRLPPAGAGSLTDAWIQLFPAFAAWAEGGVTEAAALLDDLESVAPTSDWRAFGLGQMNLALGRVRAAERAFQQMPVPAEREALLGYAALARGDTASARARLARAVPVLVESRGISRRVSTIGWALFQAELVDDIRRINDASHGVSGGTAQWLGGELAAATGDDDAALAALVDVVTRFGPGDQLSVLAIDTIARLFERRGDLLAAAAVLRRADGAQRRVYSPGGARGFAWLATRAHLLEIERRLGHTDRADAVARELEGWLIAADPDFVLRAALR